MTTTTQHDLSRLTIDRDPPPGLRRGFLREPRTVDAGPVSGGYGEFRSGLSGRELLLVGGVGVPEPGLRIRTPDS